MTWIGKLELFPLQSNASTRDGTEADVGYVVVEVVVVVAGAEVPVAAVVNDGRVIGKVVTGLVIGTAVGTA
jgi:hypothetical protein